MTVDGGATTSGNTGRLSAWVDLELHLPMAHTKATPGGMTMTAQPLPQNAFAVLGLMQDLCAVLLSASLFTPVSSKTQAEGDAGARIRAPEVASPPSWSYLAAALAPPPRGTAMEEARVDALIHVRLETMMPDSEARVASTVEQQITAALTRGGDDPVWRALTPRLDARVDAVLTMLLVDSLSPVSEFVRLRWKMSYPSGGS